MLSDNWDTQKQLQQRLVSDILYIQCITLTLPAPTLHLYSLTMHMQALTHTLSYSIMASNRVWADGATGPAQQTVVEWIYIQSLHFFLLLWSLMNSRESMEPIEVLWSIEEPSLECNLYSTGHRMCLCMGRVSVCGHFLFVYPCVSGGEQCSSGGSVHVCMH